MNPIVPLQNTNNIRYADFIRVTVPQPSGTNIEYLFSTAPGVLTIPLIGTFTGVSALLKVGDVQRDIKSTANEITVSLTGIDSAFLGAILGQNVKGSKVEMWHGFFDTNNNLITTGGINGLYKFCTGNINSLSLTESWFDELRQYFGVLTISVASIQIILQNRVAGRYTNDNSWKSFFPNDTSMNRVAFISTINYLFGKDAPANS